ncbi:MAG: PAS domain-containing protein, partial [Candidatus Zixiibacteriota bacterium]
MTTKLSNPVIGFKRCAICKIDLKGKFVYIDDQIESLIGYSKEELFGKSLSDFLDEPSQNLINKILSHRNHYETFYDTATFTLLNKEKSPIHTKIVMSLNFIAGNPVNYLMIIDPLERSANRDESNAASELYISFLIDLIELENFSDFKNLLAILLKFVKASQVCFYMIKNDSLELRSIISDESSAEFVYKQAPDTTDLHLQLAQSGEEYSFIDKKTVQKVIEKHGHAPNEYITRINYFDENSYLVRFIFSDDFEYHLAEESINN